MKKEEWEEMVSKIAMSVNALKRDVHIHFDFFDGNGDVATSYEYIN